MDIIEVGSFGTKFDAQVAVAHLQSVGIDARMVSDDAGGAIPSLTGLSGGARVMVLREDAERAREALADIEDDETSGDG